MNLSKNLRELLKNNGVSIAALSKKTGVPSQTLHNWLSGMEPRSLSQVAKIATHFGMTIDEICFGKKPVKSSISDFQDEINAGVFEVILRKPKR
jgi:transcriptional regulator with XRE-family HTH domain